MQYILSKFKIRRGKMEKTEEFLKNLNDNYQAEMQTVLKESNVMLDCSFIESNEQGDFLYIFKKLENLEQLKDKILNSPFKIYQKIRAWAEECLEGREDWQAIASFDGTTLEKK